jgi:hypothetical protein
VRGVSVGPNKVLNYIGNHSDGDEIQAISRMALSNDGKFVATLSMDDQWVKFHNISDFVEGRKIAKADDEDEDDDDDEEDGGEEDWGDSDDEDGGKKKKNNSGQKKTLKQVGQDLKKEKLQNFFSDL